MYIGRIFLTVLGIVFATTTLVTLSIILVHLPIVANLVLLAAFVVYVTGAFFVRNQFGEGTWFWPAYLWERYYEESRT